MILETVPILPPELRPLVPLMAVFANLLTSRPLSSVINRNTVWRLMELRVS